MSRFLRVGLIADGLGDIAEAAAILLREIDPESPRCRAVAADIHAMAMDLRSFLNRWRSEPIIYTGEGSTEEVIRLLDSLLREAEETARTSRDTIDER